MKATALVYYENGFNESDGSLIKCLIRYSQKYDIVGVIDSNKTGQDSGQILEDKANGIPVFENIESAIKKLTKNPECFIYGLPMSQNTLEEKERQIFMSAIACNMNIINGFPQFFTEDKAFVELAKKHEVILLDVAKPAPRDHLHVFTGRIQSMSTPVIAILGTDSEIGTFVVAHQLTEVFKEEGLMAGFVATCYTSLLLGAKHGVAIDQLTSEFVVGEIENAILEADMGQFYDLIIIEGQAPLSHPSFTSTSAILKGALPDAIVVQHAPKRKYYHTHPEISIKTLQAEIDLIEESTGPYVMAVTINGEGMSQEEIGDVIEEYEERFQIPVTDVLTHGCQKIVDQIFELFPDLQRQRNSMI